MASNLVINGVTYQSVPRVAIPKAGGGTATFYDTSDATAVASTMLDGTVAYGASGVVTGNIPSKSATTYTPNTSDQTIAAGQYLAGPQTISGDQNLVASNILSGVTIFGVSGTLSVPTVSQDSTTHVLSIS